MGALFYIKVLASLLHFIFFLPSHWAAFLLNFSYGSLLGLSSSSPIPASPLSISCIGSLGCVGSRSLSDCTAIVGTPSQLLPCHHPLWLSPLRNRRTLSFSSVPTGTSRDAITVKMTRDCLCGSLPESAGVKEIREQLLRTQNSTKSLAISQHSKGVK